MGLKGCKSREIRNPSRMSPGFMKAEEAWYPKKNKAKISIFANGERIVGSRSVVLKSNQKLVR